MGALNQIAWVQISNSSTMPAVQFWAHDFMSLCQACRITVTAQATNTPDWHVLSTQETITVSF